MESLEYESRICAFVDVLGFGDTVKRSVDERGQPMPKEIGRIVRFLSTMVRYTQREDFEHESALRTVTQFSDSLVISYPCRAQSEVFLSLLDLLYCCMEGVGLGFFLRGGVAVGPLLHTKEMVFGPALVSAYEMESKHALYPRIIVHDDVLNTAKTAYADHHTPEQELRYVKGLLTKDKDGYRYIDYIGQAQGELADPEGDFVMYMGKLCHLIEAGLKIDDAKTRKKYVWLMEKYNAVVDGVIRTIQEKPRLVEVYGAIVPIEYASITHSVLGKGLCPSDS